MKHLKFILAAIYLLAAFYFAYQIDINEARTSASLVLFLAMMGGIRIEEALQERKEEYLAEKESK